MIDAARSLLSRFQTMIRERRRPELDAWIEAEARSLLASFAGGLVKDKMAVAAALTEPWSNGQTDGQITRLKLMKRQMFGRAKLELLEARLIGAP
ncbi:transposase [Methylorubrum extorquens]|nr:transposase [Methylorubrum extorquens]